MRKAQVSLVVEYVVQGNLCSAGPATAPDTEVGVQFYLATFGKEVHLFDVEKVWRNLAELDISEFDISLQSDFFFVGDVAIDKARGECGMDPAAAEC